MFAYDTLINNLYIREVNAVGSIVEPMVPDVETNISVGRGEYRFLLMEYTRLMMELAEYKGKYRSQKRILYAALKDWDKYNAMGTAHRALFDALKEEFETETEEEAEGSLEE